MELDGLSMQRVSGAMSQSRLIRTYVTVRKPPESTAAFACVSFGNSVVQQTGTLWLPDLSSHLILPLAFAPSTLLD